jgi:hypothetical protein
MNMSIRISLRFFVSSLLILTADIAWSGQMLRLADITLPPGFSISVYAANVPGARSMTLGTKGTLFVGSRSEGKVYAISDRNGDGTADEVITIASGLRSPNGVAFRDLISDNLQPVNGCDVNCRIPMVCSLVNSPRGARHEDEPHSIPAGSQHERITGTVWDRTSL